MARPFQLPSGLAELKARADQVRTAYDQRTGCDAGSMAWHIWGEGEPLVLVHGGHGSWLQWQKNVAGLSRHRRLLVCDLPGYGDSDELLPLDDVDGHALALANGIRQLVPGTERVDVAAFSAGALIMARLDALAPHLVRRLILVGSGGLGPRWYVPEFCSVRGLTGEALREANRCNLAMFMFHDAARIDDGAIAMNMFGAPRMRSRTAMKVVPDGLVRALEQAGAPVDLIWADHDFTHPGPELHHDVVRRLQPDAGLRVIADCGHWSMGEQPEAFNAALLDLLAQPVRSRRDDRDTDDKDEVNPAVPVGQLQQC